MRSQTEKRESNVRLFTAGFDIFVLLLFVIGPSVCQGVGAEWHPRAGFNARYDDNINYSSRSREHDWIFEVRPELEWKRQSERYKLSFSGNLRGQKYAVHDELDTVEHDYGIMASKEISPALSVAFDARYRKDQTLDTEFGEEGILLSRRDRHVYKAALGGDWRSSSRSTWNLLLPFYRVNYEGLERVDYRTSGLELGYAYLLGDERTRLTISQAYSDVDFEHGGSRIYEIMCGLERGVSERLNARAMAGLSYSKTDQETAVLVGLTDTVALVQIKDDSSNDLSWTALVEIQGRSDRGNWNVRYRRDVTPTGFGESVLRDRLSVGLRRYLGVRMQFSVSTAMTEVRSQSDRTLRDYQSLQARPAFFYRITERADVNVFYAYSHLKDREDDAESNRNILGVVLDFEF